MKKIAVLCSGGVDSSVVLSLLKDKKNSDITVFYLKIWLEDELHYLGECPWEEDLAIVKKTCSTLGVDLEIIPLQREYWKKVVEKSISLIKDGYTPNPDMFCNSTIKFGSFFDFYGKNFENIATGHYAKKIEEDGWSYLALCSDKKKDQTYFLAHSDYERIQKVIFPLQSFENKEAVRKYAFEKRLPAATRKDSQGICFLGKISFTEFIKHHCGVRNGLLVDYETKAILGKHNGFWFFTIGQRQGIGLSGGPFYVVKKDIENNIVFVSKKKPNELFLTNIEILLRYLNFLVPENFYPKVGEIYAVKLRHGEQINQVLILEINLDSMRVRLLFPDQGVARGQFIVFYTKDGKCLGSGMIVD